MDEVEYHCPHCGEYFEDTPGLDGAYCPFCDREGARETG